MKNNKRGQTGLISLLVVMFIIVIVGTALIPTIAQQTGTATADGNLSLSAPSVTLLNLNTLMYAILILASVSGIGFLIMRYVGLV